MSQNERFNEFKQLIENLISSGISEETALKFVRENIEVLTSEEKDINQRIYFLLNNQDIYGIMLVNGDRYYWSNLIGDELSELKTLDESDNEKLSSADFIVEMIINFANSDKIKRIMPEISNLNIENKLKALKNLNLNANGYHIK